MTTPADLKKKTHLPSKCPFRDNNGETFGCTACMPLNQSKTMNDDYVKQRALANPFNYNYLFSKKDLKREDLNIATRICLLFRPMLIQIADGMVFHFKVGSRGEIYFFYADKL